MFIDDLLKERKMSKYRLAKLTDIPYSTINDICNHHASINKCNVLTVYKIANALNVTIEDLLEPKRIPFESFKSNVCHEVKRLSDIPFINKTIEDNKILHYLKLRWYPEALYLLAMIDYLSRINKIPLNNDYDSLRKLSLTSPHYPISALVADMVNKNNLEKQRVKKEAIPEFKRFNIMESEIRNVY
ncbi:MAG: helix-turn-helix transcriptional regulator [Bacilli bacterium]|nr:helix-turn-helix transcriptional regulator [Bacilli bacterium]